MNVFFADTFYYLALLNEDDVAHDRAVESSRARSGRTVTTAWVLTELADALAAPKLRPFFMALLDQLQANPRVVVVSASSGLFDRGIDLYSRRPDKEWSLTDCISFIVMEEQGISDALTGDHHYEQAGFHALLA
jgi:uncharacterized protein